MSSVQSPEKSKINIFAQKSPEKEGAKATVAESKVNPVETKKAPRARKENAKVGDKDQKREYSVRKHNVIIVRKNTSFRTLVMLAKTLLKNQFETIELHAVDDQSYLTITLVCQCLMKYKYVTLDRLKTKTVQVLEEEKGNQTTQL